MGCGSFCMKCILHVFNIIYALGGVLLIVTGVFLLKSAVVTQAYVLIGLGSLNVITSIIGCCGICFENVCLTSSYAVVILMSLIGQIYNICKPSSVADVTKLIREGVMVSWNKEVETQGAMDEMQQAYKCCGLNGPDDYNMIRRPFIPSSCYKDNNSKLFENRFNIGCTKALENSFNAFAKYQSGGEWVSLAITIIVVIFAAALVYKFNQKERFRY